jgi:hydroxymethylpyrimidine/phosphomethylpyrimidine kinase
MAAGLARGEGVPEAAQAAKAFVTRAIRASYVAGQGRFLSLGFSDREE